ncbi:MAG: hypothetical protein Q4D60_05870 [Eubacteriales bacterium]|nr:hypothetical protein [Eubacteriales bacterium]
MSQSIFRKKSLDRISSPERMNDYIKLSNPSAWMCLAAVLLFLTGTGIWAGFGQLDEKMRTVVMADKGELRCYVKEEEADSLKKGMPLFLKGEEYVLGRVPEYPMEVTEAMPSYLCHLAKCKKGDWIYEISVGATSLPDGIYEAQIVVESGSPLSFVMK